MNRFGAGRTATAVVAAPRPAIWKVLTDPDAIAELTPYLSRVEASGDHWRWEMGGLEVLGHHIAPVFTERMVFLEPERIEFRHEPPFGQHERAGVDGWYALSEVPGSQPATRLEINLEVSVELPLPRIAAPAVRAAMTGVIATMGARFSTNLLRHLGVR